MPGEAIPKKNTGQFLPQGQTAGAYGNDPTVDARGHASEGAVPLKP